MYLGKYTEGEMGEHGGNWTNAISSDNNQI